MVGRPRRASPARRGIEEVAAVENVVYVEIEAVAVVGFQRAESPVAVSVAQVAFGCQIGVGVGRVVEITANHHRRLRMSSVQTVGFGTYFIRLSRPLLKRIAQFAHQARTHATD